MSEEMKDKNVEAENEAVKEPVMEQVGKDEEVAAEKAEETQAPQPATPEELLAQAAAAFPTVLTSIPPSTCMLISAPILSAYSRIAFTLGIISAIKL